MSEINALVGHYRDKYGIESHVLRPMTIGPGNVDFSRRQVIAEALGNSMLRIYADYVSNGSARLIGITGSDMYARAPWRYRFSWRFMGQHASVISTARMTEHYAGEPPAEATVSQRLRKMVTKDIGILYYGKPLSINPKSVLYAAIGSLEEFDQMSEEFLSQ